MDALRNYLAWQADLGSDEVILPPPPASRRPGGDPARAASDAGAGPQGPASRGAAERIADFRRAARDGVDAAPAGLFQMLARSLEGADAVQPALPKVAGIPVQEAPPKAVLDAAFSLPVLGSLEEYRKYLDHNIRDLLAGGLKSLGGRLVHGTGPQSAPLALVGMEPGAEDIQAGSPFHGECGGLLEKMMRAIRLDFGSLYRTLVVKTGGEGRAWTRRDLVRLLPLFQAELVLAGAGAVLLLGETCAQAVLKTGKSIEELRQVPHYLDGVPGREFAVTYHPLELIGNEELKRKAWKDLQWLRARLDGGSAWN